MEPLLTWEPKKIIIGLVVCGAALAFTAGVTLAETDYGPETMILKTAKAKKPATFPHALHQKSVTCDACHHGKNDDGSQKPFVDGQKNGKCVSCHNPDLANTKLNSFKNAAHSSCKSCHKIMAKAAQKTGPTKCNGCHIK